MKNVAICAIFAMLSLSSAALAQEKPQQPPTDLQQIRSDLHELYGLMVDQIDLMRTQDEQFQVLRIDLARLAQACGRRPAAPPVWSEPEK
jgi:hypothetical protein